MVNGEVEGCGDGLYPKWGGVLGLRGAMPLPGNDASYIQKGRNLVYMFVYLLFQHEIIVDSELAGDAVHALIAARLTSVSGRIPGILGDFGPLHLLWCCGVWFRIS